MSNYIEKSGTGINKSAAAIHQSGTGIEKGGTGRRLPGFFLGMALAAACFAGQAVAADPDLIVSNHGHKLFVSLHTDTGICAGGVARNAGTDGYYQVPLRRVTFPADGGLVFSTEVQGTGSGSSSESSSAVGGSLMVQGTGSGNAGEASGGCDSSASLELTAEIVVDRSGSHILVLDQYGTERLVAFVAAADRVAWEFVATP